jgi:secreted PhoX family phosphatase
MRKRVRFVAGAAGLVAAFGVGTAIADSGLDFGRDTQAKLTDKSDKYFGIEKPLPATAALIPGSEGAQSVALAEDLKVVDVLRGVPGGDLTDQLYQNADMIAFWPNDEKPEWALVCIENGPAVPGVQRVKLRLPNKGRVETLLSGTIACDGIRRTPWNTIVATEETSDGNAIEIYDPIGTDGVSFNRATGVATGADAANVVARPALGRFAWEGLEILPDGTVYGGDELRPENDVDGGAVFRFVSSQKPAQPLSPATIATLSNSANAAQSPLAAGTLEALRVGGTGTLYGQGNQRGLGKWIGPVAPATARASAATLKATGYYRPEDLHLDPIAWAKGVVKFCWANTGVSSVQNWGEVLCAEETAAGPVVQTFWEGNNLANQPDNLAFQPGTGNLYIIEDTPTVNGTPAPGDIWACLPDGADDNLHTDGCVRVLSVRTGVPGVDISEPTGFIFDASGKRAYLNVQHSPDNPATAAVDEGKYDEMLVIEGFDVRSPGEDS